MPLTNGTLKVKLGSKVKFAVLHCFMGQKMLWCTALILSDTKVSQELSVVLDWYIISVIQIWHFFKFLSFLGTWQALVAKTKSWRSIFRGTKLTNDFLNLPGLVFTLLIWIHRYQLQLQKSDHRLVGGVILILDIPSSTFQYLLHQSFVPLKTLRYGNGSTAQNSIWIVNGRFSQTKMIESKRFHIFVSGCQRSVVQ